MIIGATATSSSARLTLENTIAGNGASTAIAGLHGIYTFNPTGGGVQVGNRLALTNSPTSVANTAVGQIIRITDSSSLANLVRGIDLTASAGTNTLGVNTGIRAVGHTFGVQGLTTGLAGGTLTPAALYGESSGTTVGDVLRLYTDTMTSASAMATFYQASSTYSGAGLVMDLGNPGVSTTGAFSGYFLNLKNNGTSMFNVDSAGTTTMAGLLKVNSTTGTSTIESALTVKGILKVGNFTESYTSGHGLLVNSYVKATGYNLRPPNVADAGFIGLKSSDGSDYLDFYTSSTNIITFGNTGANTGPLVDIRGGTTNPTSGSAAKTFVYINPQLNAGGGYTGNIVGLDYNPTITSLGGATHYAALFREGNVGIGTSTPGSKLSVSGGVSIGANYGVAAPANSLIVEGSLGVGTTSPSHTVGVNTTSNNLLLMQNTSNGYGLLADVFTEADYTSRLALGIMADPTKRLSIFWNDATSESTIRSGAVSNLKKLNLDANSFVFNTGSVGIGTSTPWAKLSINNYSAGASTMPLFTIASSTGAAATSTEFIVTSVGNVGIGTSSPAQKLVVQGTIRQTNCVSATLSANSSGDIECTSDERLKDIHGSYEGSIASLAQINPIRYSFKNDGSYEYVGFSAQNIQSVLPQGAPVQGSGYLGLNTTAILALTVNAVKELNLHLELLASSTPGEMATTSQSFVEGFFENMFTKMREWFASAANGITDFFANRIRTKELCVGDESGAETCITKQQLDALLSGAINAGGGQVTTTPPPEPTPEPEPEPETDPAVVTEPEPTSEAPLEESAVTEPTEVSPPEEMVVGE